MAGSKAFIAAGLPAAALLIPLVNFRLRLGLNTDPKVRFEFLLSIRRYGDEDGIEGESFTKLIGFKSGCSELIWTSGLNDEASLLICEDILEWFNSVCIRGRGGLDKLDLLGHDLSSCLSFTLFRGLIFRL